jgi:hypothetical protein
MTIAQSVNDRHAGAMANKSVIASFVETALTPSKAKSLVEALVVELYGVDEIVMVTKDRAGSSATPVVEPITLC